MIDKLRNKVFWAIQIPFTLIIICIMIMYGITTYHNTITSSNTIMNRFMGEDIKNNYRNEVFERNRDFEIDGIYIFFINNDGSIKTSNNTDSIIEEYAIKVSQKNNNNGIIGKYIYQKRMDRTNTIRVTLVEDENSINHIKLTIILSIIIAMVFIVIIYFIAKKVSRIIVKPAQDTIEKQKQFISDVSHELKTPLAVIQTNADVLKSNPDNSKWLNYIEKEIESMDKLVNKLLILAELEDNREIGNEEINLSREIKLITSVFESMAYDKQIKLETNIEEDIKYHCDKEDIKSILSVLIDNAIKHTNQNQKVRIKLKKNKSKIEIQVQNEGDPIPEEEREKIFERFYRVDKSRNRSDKRYGLGLTIAKETVEKYNGTIRVECNNGITSFIIEL